MERTVVVTGGSRGIGAAIVERFHAKGASVLIAARTDGGLPARLGDRVRHIECDARRPKDLEAAAHAAVQWTGRLDAWVNNAGRSDWKRLEDVDEAFWTDMVDINLKSAAFGAKAAAAHMNAGAAIINIASLAGRRGSANNSVYCAAKFGVIGLTQALAKELGPRGIRVNAVCPVYVQTPGLAAALEDPAAPSAGMAADDYLAGFVASQSALGRLPEAEEVANACAFLASDAASAITGQSINVDCGVLPF